MADYIKIRLEEYNELKLKMIELDKLKKIMNESKEIDMYNKRYKYYLSKVRERFSFSEIGRSISLGSAEYHQHQTDIFDYNDIYEEV